MTNLFHSKEFAEARTHTGTQTGVLSFIRFLFPLQSLRMLNAISFEISCDKLCIVMNAISSVYVCDGDQKSMQMI